MQEFTNAYLLPARLPDDWEFLDGLRYPMLLTLADGSKLEVQNYQVHHTFIQIAIKGTEQERNDYIASIRNT